MNDSSQITLNGIIRSENKSELGLKLVDIFKNALKTDLDRLQCKPLQFASQLNEVHCCSDPFRGGDHPDTMLAILARNLQVAEDEEKSKAISEEEGLKCKMYCAEDVSAAEMREDQAVDLMSQRLLREGDAWKSIKPCKDLRRKCCELLRLLGQDLLVADLKISLYITACNNVKVKPFPEDVAEETADGLFGLALVNNLIPPVEVLKLFLEKRRYKQLNENVINVVHWLMVQLRQPKLIALPVENFDSVFERVEYAVNLQSPAHIVKIMVNNLSSNYLQWQAAKGQLPTKFAFYGARVEHIHSMVHLGLYPFQKVTGPLGKGIYLTTDLKRCLDSSPPSWVWGKSVIGTQLQTVAVVEFIDNHSTVVSYRDNPAMQQQGRGKPFNYYIPNKSLIQARYLLIYVKDSHQAQVSPVRSKQGNLNKILMGGIFLSGYLTLCYVAWKSVKNTNDTMWDVLIDKLKKTHFLEQLPFFIRSSVE